MIQSIQNGPYKNIYNPENFFIGSQGSGAANNWGAGYAAGEKVQEEVFDMIDREADGSDSLEVIPGLRKNSDRLELILSGFHAAPFDRWRDRLWAWQLHPGANE